MTAASPVNMAVAREMAFDGLPFEKTRSRTGWRPNWNQHG
jgi:hypothetical protein